MSSSSSPIKIICTVVDLFGEEDRQEDIPDSFFLLFHRSAQEITLTRYLKIVRSRQSERIMHLHCMKGQLPVSGAPFGSCHLSCSEIEPKFQRALQVASQAVTGERLPKFSRSMN